MIPPLPRLAGPRTRTLEIAQSGASERTIPAQAVPCPYTSPSSSSSTWAVVSSAAVTLTARSSPPTIGWEASTPLSRMQTRAPSPVEPPRAHSRLTSNGHSDGSEIASASVPARLLEGSGSAAPAIGGPSVYASSLFPAAAGGKLLRRERRGASGRVPRPTAGRSFGRDGRGGGGAGRRIDAQTAAADGMKR